MTRFDSGSMPPDSTHWRFPLVRAGLGIAWMTFKTVVAIAVAAFLWLYLLEELGMGSWECWVR